MTSAEILALIHGGENSRVEFKEQIPRQADDLAKEVAALATGGGGYLLIGVRDDGSLCGLEDLQSVKNRLEGIVQNAVEPLVQFDCLSASFDGVNVLCVEIKNGMEPVYYAKGKPVLRQGTMSRAAKPDEVKHLILQHDALVRASSSRSALASHGVAAAISGQGELATMNFSDLVKRLDRRNRQKLA